MADTTKTFTVVLTANSSSFSKAFNDAASSSAKVSEALKPAAANTEKWSEANQRAALRMERLHEEALKLNASMSNVNDGAVRLADNMRLAGSTIDGAAKSFGVTTEAAKTLGPVADVATVGMTGLTKSIAGFNAATLGIIGAGAAIGAAIGNFANKFQAVRDFADNATRGLYDFLAANKLFESTRDAGAGAEAGLTQFRIAMAAKHTEALEKQVAALRASGQTDKEIADFYKGSLGPALEKKLGLTKEDIKAEDERAAAAKRAAEQFQALVDQLSGRTAQQEVDQLAKALHVVGIQGVGDIEALRSKLEQLEKQGAKITDKGLLGVLAGKKIEIPKLVDTNSLDLGADTANQVEHVAAVGLEAQQAFNGMAQAFAVAKAPAEDIEAALRLAGASAAQVKVALASIPALGLGASLKAGLAAGLKGLPQVILGAIQGGGDVGKAIGTHLGGTIGENIAGPLTKKLSDALGKGLGSALGSIIPGLGSLLGSGIGSLLSKGLGKIGSFFGGLFGGGEVKKVNDLRDAFFQAQGGFVELQKKLSGLTSQDLVKRIFDAKTVDEFNAAVAQVTGLLGDQQAAQDALKEATDRYGFSIEELGPAMQRQELDKQAGQLFQDFQLLTASGIDVKTVIEKMGPSLVDFVNTARQSGQAIPEAMRPVIDQLIASGQLVDENGQAYKSAEEAGITFAQTMSEQFQTLIGHIEDLVSALTGIPKDVNTNVNVNTNYTSSGQQGQHPDLPNVDNLPSFATGGIGDFGPGALAMLHGTEAIIPVDRNGRPRDGAMGFGRQTTINLAISENPMQSAESREQMRRFTLDSLYQDLSANLVDRIEAGAA